MNIFKMNFYLFLWRKYEVSEILKMHKVKSEKLNLNETLGKISINNGLIGIDRSMFIIWNKWLINKNLRSK